MEQLYLSDLSSASLLLVKGHIHNSYCHTLYLLNIHAERNVGTMTSHTYKHVCIICIYIYIWSVISFYLSIYSNLTKSILYYSKLIYIIHVISESNLCNIFIYLSVCLSIYLFIYIYIYIYIYQYLSISIYLSFFLHCIAVPYITLHTLHTYIHT